MKIETLSALECKVESVNGKEYRLVDGENGPILAEHQPLCRACGKAPMLRFYPDGPEAQGRCDYCIIQPFAMKVLEALQDLGDAFEQCENAHNHEPSKTAADWPFDEDLTTQISKVRQWSDTIRKRGEE